MFFPGSTVMGAELFKNMKFSGQIDLQATSAHNVTDFTTQQKSDATGPTNNDRIGDAQTRIMLSLDWDLLDDVHAKATVRKNDRNYGTATGNANTNANSQNLIGTAGNTGALDNTYLDQAYFKIDKIGGHVDATFGRQFYGESGDMVVYYGPSDKALYGLPTTSIDAVRADWSNDKFGVIGLVGKTTGHSVGVAPALVPDVDVRGIVAACKGDAPVHLGVSLWNQVTHNTGAVGVPPTVLAAGGKNDNLWVADVKAKASMGMGWANAEFAKNFGENRGLFTTDPNNSAANNAHYTGWAMQFNVGAKLDLASLGAVAPWGHFGYGSGDGSVDGTNHTFTAINPDYRPGSIYGRFAVAAGGASLGSAGTGFASNSLSNRKIWGVGVKTTPSMMNKLTAGLAFWDYSVTADPGPVFGGNKHLGSEADLDLTWAHSENVSLGAGVGQFWPGGAVK